MESNNNKLRAQNRQLTRDVHSQQQDIKVLERQLKIEQDLLESQERFKTVFEASISANKIINTDLKMIQINQALCDFLGYSKEEILGTTILEYTRPDFIQVWYDLHEALWTKELPAFQLETCLIRRDKTEVWCLVNTVRFKHKEETFGYTSLADITSRKKLERHKDEFISTVSHELKTPLTSIKAYSQMLLRYFDSLSDEKPKELLRRMDNKVDTLSTLIKGLVMASRIDDGKLNPRSEEYEVDKLLTEVIDDFRSSITDRNITVTDSVPLRTKGDRAKIEQVLQNLITNAIKFSAADIKICISLTRENNEALICIQDQGRGIASESI